MAYPVHDKRGYTLYTDIDPLYPGSEFLDGLPVEPNIREITFQTLGFKIPCNQIEN